VLSVARKHLGQGTARGTILRIGFIMRQRSGAVSLDNRPDFSGGARRMKPPKG
jgi:hypothetical protein